MRLQHIEAKHLEMTPFVVSVMKRDRGQRFLDWMQSRSSGAVDREKINHG